MCEYNCAYAFKRSHHLESGYSGKNRQLATSHIPRSGFYLSVWGFLSPVGVLFLPNAFASVRSTTIQNAQLHLNCCLLLVLQIPNSPLSVDVIQSRLPKSRRHHDLHNCLMSLTRRIIERELLLHYFMTNRRTGNGIQ